MCEMKRQYLRLSAMADHHQQQQLLGSEGGSPPTKRARLDPNTCSETCGKLVGTKVGLDTSSLSARLDS